ncbi:hypothetical protein DSO57_1031396 [Entomophthora muscae]|uniref:Uncharacterized protein n=1 Tax=Entomophthora muscae TaxID=34485 RepID=A0ACC2UAH9_9FUNG|nr:hypothetical protein DSO57_1031396 [Entomophthora muscae]
MKGYKKRSKNIIQLIGKLRDEGAAMDIDLPTVVFCGNQSAGKSSLIESISGIMLPRSDGTCTRCPMELRLSEGKEEDWECSISLQFQNDKYGKRLSKPKEYEFKTGIRNKNDVENAVRCAQKAILNPNNDSSAYKDYDFDDSSLEARMTDVNSNQLTFTYNTVCIKISGSTVNLTLIDLPGLIRTTESSLEISSIALVEGMDQTYIGNPRALIIAAISCKDEIENQAIFTLAKEV